jgi:hypothetical protein
MQAAPPYNSGRKVRISCVHGACFWMLLDLHFLPYFAVLCAIMHIRWEILTEEKTRCRGDNQYFMSTLGTKSHAFLQSSLLSFPPNFDIKI